MKCDACNEVLDERDIREEKYLSCWRCGRVRELSVDEKKEYVEKYDPYEDYDGMYARFYDD